MAPICLFDKQKRDCFSKIDLSRKGSIDEPIVSLINKINQHNNYFSLSSCSGRIVVFAETESEEGRRVKGGGKNSGTEQQGTKVKSEVAPVVKVNCDWILVSHEPADPDEVLAKLEARTGKPGCVVVKFEPFVLHVQCRELTAAKLVHTAAVEAGFRNSGITVGKSGKFVSAVRSTHGLEVPLSTDTGELLVTPGYIRFLLDKANLKLKENFGRIAKFEEQLDLLLGKEEEGGEKRRRGNHSAIREVREKRDKSEVSEDPCDIETGFMFAE